MSDAPSKQAVAAVLSGGGANGAYEVGVLKALAAGASPATGYRPLDMDIYCGTSVGAFNAAFMTSCSHLSCADAATSLARVWLDKIAEGPGQCNNGVLRLRFDPSELVDPSCLKFPFALASRLLDDAVHYSRSVASRALQFASSSQPLSRRSLEMIDIGALLSAGPLEETLRGALDLRMIRESRRKLRVTVTDWEHGEALSFTNKDFDDRIGHAIVQASCSIPGVLPSVEIDGVACIDGCVLENTPLKRAIYEGADDIHMIYLDIELNHVSLDPVGSTFETVDRLAECLFSQSANREIETAALVNQGLALLERLQQPGTAPTDEESRAFLHVATKVRQRLASSGRYRLLTIHRYRPKRYLGGLLGMLNFERGRIESLIEEGYRDAVEHDCRACECIVPEEPR